MSSSLMTIGIESYFKSFSEIVFSAGLWGHHLALSKGTSNCPSQVRANRPRNSIRNVPLADRPTQTTPQITAFQLHPKWKPQSRIRMPLVDSSTPIAIVASIKSRSYLSPWTDSKACGSCCQRTVNNPALMPNRSKTGAPGAAKLW